MSHRSCFRETAVARAVRTGDWNQSLEAHLRECATCREVREAARWMQALAREPQGENDPPDPQILWLRAQLSQRQAGAERAEKILQWAEVACITAACAGLALWLAWNWNAIGSEVADGLNWALFEAWPAVWANGSAYGPMNAPILFLAALAAISVVTIAIAYPLVARE